uniref:Uncharacterized protein n=1 Tax=Kalanchoe fedtschenkoi TaxID=63787 RepID=A0A7N0UCE0_KALFE
MAYRSAGGLLVMLLGLSQLIIGLHAAPATRTSRIDAQAYQVSEKTHSANADEVVMMDVELVNGYRMDIEINDYPGSGANNRHTPKPPQRCGDC